MRKVVANLVYAFVALPVMLGALFLAGASPRLLDRDTWTGAVGDERLWAAVRSFDPPQAELEEAVASLPGGTRVDARRLWNAARSELPWDDIRVQALNTLADAWDEARGSGTDDAVRIEPFRTILENRADEIAATYAAGLGSAPPGTATDPTDLTVLPPGTSAKDAARALEAALRAGIAKIPDSVPLAAIDAPADGLMAARGALPAVRTTTLFLGGALWLGLGFLASGAWSRRIRWLGTTLAIPAGITLAAGLLLRLPVDAVVAGALRSPELSAALSGPAAAGLASWLRDLVALVANGFLVSGGAASLVAAAALGASRPLEAAEDEAGEGTVP